jgi:hypothetical protein
MNFLITQSRVITDRTGLNPIPITHTHMDGSITAPSTLLFSNLNVSFQGRKVRVVPLRGGGVGFKESKDQIYELIRY